MTEGMYCVDMTFLVASSLVVVFMIEVNRFNR